MLSIIIACFAACPALASMPGPPPPGTPVYTVQNHPQKHQVTQNAAWIALKNEFKVHRNQKKLVPASYPSSAQLSTSTVATTLEPSANLPGSGYTGSKDDANQNYVNRNMVNLCVPGALTNALTFWGRPVTSYGTHLFTDLSVQNTHPSGITVQTTWADRSFHDVPTISNSYTHRAYMMYMAWLVNPGGQWTSTNLGVMDDWNYPSTGATLQDEAMVANWEASGDNSSNWENYFYVISWHYDSIKNPGGSTQATLLSDVESDVSSDSVPVLVEVDASKLPNWPSGLGRINHAIALIKAVRNTPCFSYGDASTVARGDPVPVGLTP